MVYSMRSGQSFRKIKNITTYTELSWVAKPIARHPVKCGNIYSIISPCILTTIQTIHRVSINSICDWKWCISGIWCVLLLYVHVCTLQWLMHVNDGWFPITFFKVLYWTHEHKFALFKHAHTVFLCFSLLSRSLSLPLCCL